MPDAGRLVGGITIAALIGIGLIAALVTSIWRSRQKKQETPRLEEGRPEIVPERTRKSRPPELPLYRTRQSLSTISEQNTPNTARTVRTPGIRFMITSPSLISPKKRDRGSVDSLPSVETVLEQYEKEAESDDKMGEEDLMLTEEELGEPGPSVLNEVELSDPGLMAMTK